MIFMKNKKIIDSWNSIAPDESAEKRMLKAILDKNHNVKYEEHPDEDGDIITNEYTVSKGKNAKQILRTALPAAACVALIFGVVKFTSDYLPAGDNNDNEINIPTGETSDTVISEMTESEKSTDSSFSSVSEMTAVTDIPANSDTDASSAVSSDENQKSSETAGTALTESQKVEKKETERTVPANTEPETADKEENPKTQKVTDPKYITTTVTTESKPRQTLPEVTTVPAVKRLITKDELIGLSKKGDSLKLSDLKSFEFEDIGSGIYILRYPVENTDYALCLFYQRSWVDDSQTPDETALVRMNSNDLRGIDIRESTPEQILAVLNDETEEKKNIPLDFILAQFSRNAHLTWTDLEKYKASDGSTEYQKQYRIENSFCSLYARGNDNGYVTSAVLVLPESAWGETADIYRNSPEQLLAFEGGVTTGLSAENIKQITFTEYNSGKTIVLDNSEAFLFSAKIRRFHIGNQVSGWRENNGSLISYTVEYSDGTTRNISVMHPYIIVDGTAYYSTIEDISVFTDYAEHLKSKQ